MKTSLDEKPSAPSLMVETYPIPSDYSKLHGENVEDHFKVNAQKVFKSRTQGGKLFKE